jgi:hypothetical protein
MRREQQVRLGILLDLPDPKAKAARRFAVDLPGAPPIAYSL